MRIKINKGASMCLVETQLDIVNRVEADVPRKTFEAVTGDRNLGKFTFKAHGTCADGVSLASETGTTAQGGVRDESRVNKFSLKGDESAALVGVDIAASLSSTSCRDLPPAALQPLPSRLQMLESPFVHHLNLRFNR
ncbi:hypothetical protein [Arthrobacter sp. JUb115]|uniref:hypothetical protein n=2 Tax=Micrococcaceae TaxID=1268 RepID=UPI0010605D16|nr:hypothetical protein [Arthrobacter sp. JUb115]